MQEVRHICADQTYQTKKDILTKAYVSELIDTIPILQEGNVVKDELGNVIFTEHLFYYEGEKISGESYQYQDL